jgi:hypothetical protein
MLSVMTRRLLVTAVAVPALFSIQGCTDQEVLGTIAGAAIVGGAVAVGVAASKDHDRRGDGRDDRRGDGRDDRRGDYGDGRDGGRYHSFAATGFAIDNNVAFATRYNVPVSAAVQLNTALKASVSAQNLQPVYELGLSKADLENIGQLSMISNGGITQLASKLQISEAQTRGLVQQMITDISAQAKDENSALWRSCVDSGSWKTPQNAWCESTSWSGCSPATGASFCTISK